MVDRTQAPSYSLSSQLTLPRPQECHLAGGVPLVMHRVAHGGLVKVAFVAQAGRWEANDPAVSYLMAKMLRKGTECHDQRALAEFVDYHGATLHCHADNDRLHLSLTVLPNHLGPMLALMGELTTACTFPEEALVAVKAEALQALAYMHANPAKRAAIEGATRAFGSDHPYGWQLTPALIEGVTRKELMAYYKRCMWQGAQCTIEGELPEGVGELMEHHLGHKQVIRLTTHPAYRPAPTPRAHHVAREGASQAAIVLAKPTITRRHSDYLALYMTQGFLGGYFGSRLMQVIREEKGYTYGIYSRLTSYGQEGYLAIHTEVGVGLVAKTLEAIRAEVVRLQDTLVAEEALQRFKQYLAGSLLSGFDAPFALTDRVREVQLQGLDLAYYERLYAALWAFDAVTLQATAQRYLALDSFAQVVVGP